MKLKTRKSIAKRFKLSGKKPNRWGKAPKLIRKSAGQDHFNARESSKTTTKKRRRHSAFASDQKNIRRFMPR
ncbi:hypothetical protein A3H10_02765 [Candidatus Uhrbacteria bacterium RIFCSPLOWO2_12_FULL_46_10]|uniref:50S ribosomal protein L35 n=1 Tax=Candidatus Uhrbacteria bacterium RIFCSPLOWO2_01_FULL_47_25 TaxID=1802402 RepID=A0A1F7UUN9_9BACT|nr:MAG: hypothetical protein A2752_00335 [Candidatus Uhrbacteria bacterium RIFCSPHIGHO2_01_FULL_46_23]OGL68231.1 MAG: hypothetical protein A3D60_00370 [Candidatus Uhrbacteria bacterium RIFCSPHIGHO2_02_FULL_47_29]OGL81975.1 MAG: hypothetical protein A2936_05405 [Candidatus Uhrbacteria bacterium RIFCSPLOWO2_01_FULL_47_25]OGL86050.1 MAG: hypothetical protein A3I37_03945 [Candidatus Uhrbacteria bacterium RIFCSPLOWO2_02_FULL_46_19]OGL90243.1 MAG: hypothetical protein A3H10_02765 [Candidatus Uhrbacte